MASKANRLITFPTVSWPESSMRWHLLDDIIKKNNVKKMTEVGVRDGRNIFYLLDNNPKLEVIAIDGSIKGFYNDAVKEKYGKRLKPIEALSDEASFQVKDNSQDLIFIDADHSYEWVKKDIVNYRKKLKKGGWLTGHDIDRVGVNRAVKETLSSYDIGPNYVWFTQL